MKAVGWERDNPINMVENGDLKMHMKRAVAGAAADIGAGFVLERRNREVGVRQTGGKLMQEPEGKHILLLTEEQAKNGLIPSAMLAGSSPHTCPGREGADGVGDK